jgi:hypothetical protein
MVFGKAGARRQFWMLLVDGAGLALHVVHQQVLAEGVRGGEVGIAATHLGDLLDELYQAVV